MERIDEAGDTQESSRRRPWPLGRTRAQRRQAAGQSGKWSQRWFGQKPGEDARGTAQRPAAAARPREEVIGTLIAAIRGVSGMCPSAWVCVVFAFRGRGMRIRPDLALEHELWRTRVEAVAGVDEVGVGAWAGPVVAAAVMFAPGGGDRWTGGFQVAHGPAA
jgi:hypothetical protein